MIWQAMIISINYSILNFFNNALKLVYKYDFW